MGIKDPSLKPCHSAFRIPVKETAQNPKLLELSSSFHFNYSSKLFVNFKNLISGGKKTRMLSKRALRLQSSAVWRLSQ